MFFCKLPRSIRKPQREIGAENRSFALPTIQTQRGIAWETSRSRQRELPFP